MCTLDEFGTKDMSICVMTHLLQASEHLVISFYSYCLIFILDLLLIFINFHNYVLLP